MNLAQELLTGSARVDQWRKEIASLVDIVIGFLTTADYRAIGTGRVVPLIGSDTHRWTISYNRTDGIRFRLFHREDGKDLGQACELPGNPVRLEYVGFVHFHLSSLVAGLRRMFPELDRRWGTLLRVGRDEFRIYYELHFFGPADEPFFGDDQELLEFRKMSGLSFPLPLDTEVFVFAETSTLKDAEGEDADCFFRVVGYKHQINDIHGHLQERNLAMILVPTEEYISNAAEPKFRRVLEASGWVRSD